MQVILSALGSYGDVHPFVGLGSILRSRGHDVAIIANPYFQSLIERFDLEHIPLLDREDYERLTDDSRVWQRFTGPQIVLRECARSARAIYHIVSQRYRPGETVFGAHGLDMGSRVAQEKHGIPLASIHLAPLAIRSNLAVPRYPGMLTHPAVPTWLVKLQHWLVDRLVIDRILSRSINGLRSEVGLQQPVSRFLNRWWYSPDLVLCLFPEWFAPRQADWPPNCQLAGFPLWDESNDTFLAPEVESFLASGDPPVVFTPGSAMRFGRDFFATACEACHRSDLRGILLTRYPEQLPSHLPSTVRHFEYVPFSRLLPRSAAVVHHGGIGSTSQGLAAGVPQLIYAMNFDQPDNGARLEKLGVGAILPPRRFTSPAVAATLRRLVDDVAIRQRCRQYATRCDGDRALTEAAAAMERLLSREGQSS